MYQPSETEGRGFTAVFRLVLIQEIHEHLHHINLKMMNQAWLELFIVKIFVDLSQKFV